MGKARTERATDSGVASLVERAAAGDSDAQRKLLAAVLPTLRAATRAILGRGADADDATQQAAIDALRGLPNLRGEGEASVNAWARTIGVRAALRHARARRRHMSAVDPADLEPAQPATESLKDRVPGQLQAYLDQLPAVQREALVLRHALGYTVPEIAEVLDTSPNTVKSRLLQARKEVRRLIRQRALVGATSGGQR